MAGEPTINLLVHCHSLPGVTFEAKSDIRLGIQRGKDVIDEVGGDADAVTFSASVRVGRNADGSPNFLGPYAHGPVGDRFLYLSWSGIENGTRAMFRRAKLRLRGIGWPTLEQAIATERPLEVTVNMTGKRGGPACATLEEQGATWRLG